MTTQLEAIFGELGIAQYLDIFLEQGFDTWETILDITESDLDALGVKLGYRRKLQRRIANFRGLSLEQAITSPVSQPPNDEPKPELQPPAPVKVETQHVVTVVVPKRKYRRHPKPDENAPERPPSAYVLFSNKMRDDLKGRNLTFTEMAKLVGEHWQNLAVAEKEPFESQAQAAKDRYNNQLTEYKKTAEYRRYQEYLEEFKSKYAHQSKDKDGTKRVKLSPGATNVERRTGNSMGPGRSGSGSPGAPARTGDGRRHHRLSSVVSATESHASATPAVHPASLDDGVHSPLDGRSSDWSPMVKPSPRDIAMGQQRTPFWHDDQPSEQREPPRLLPSLSDVFDPPPPPSLSSAHSSIDSSGYPFPRSYSRDSAGPPPDLIDGPRRAAPPALKKEQSSAGSISSASSYSYPRTPIEGSLPIHALLSEKLPQPLNSMMQFHGSSNNTMAGDHKSPFPHRQHSDGTALPYTNGFHVPQLSPLSATPLPTPQQSYPPAQPAPSRGRVKREPDLDGMAALLRAGEMVDNRPT